MVRFHKALTTNQKSLCKTFADRAHQLDFVASYLDSNEWIVEVTNFLLYGPVDHWYYVFFDGSYYASKVVGGQIVMDDWTNLPKMVPKVYRHLCLQPTSFIHRKVMLYPDPANKQSLSFYLVIDQEVVDFSPVQVPFYPIAGEVVEVRSTDRCAVVVVNSIDGYNQVACKWNCPEENL